MTIPAAFTVSILIATTLVLKAHLNKEHIVHCPCGNTGKNFTAYITETREEENPCRRWSYCKKCQDGIEECLECPDGFRGPFCYEVVTEKGKSRQKRQNRYFFNGRPSVWQVYPTRRRSGSLQNGVCEDIDSPKLGSIRCVYSDRQRTCVGKCLPGYTFENEGHENEITLTCQEGVWTPKEKFPPCKSDGLCELVVHGGGSFNCTLGMGGTRCDVNCGGRYAGRFHCYPGQEWNPPLPYCVRSKGAVQPPEEIIQRCQCQYGGRCDRNGKCICPAGRTGVFCETVIREKKTCKDPGFVDNGSRKNTDGTESNSPRQFQPGESLVYGCSFEDYALQGSAFLSCQEDGTWSESLPKCIRTTVSSEVLCPDPGQVSNADRLNSDGSPSVGVQSYHVGQSVVYTCHPGFALQRRSLITCLVSGSWSDRTPYCTRIAPPSPIIRTTTERPDGGLRFCRDPGVDSNGSRSPKSPPSRRGFPQGFQMEYSCNPGYDLYGQKNIFCLISGLWSSARPTCSPISWTPDRDTSETISCDNPGPLTNGQIVHYPNGNNRRTGSTQSNLTEAKYPQGTRLEYSCNNGYTLVGSASLICEDYGYWSEDPPTCRRVSTPAESPRYCRRLEPIANGQYEYIPSINERRRPQSNNEDEEFPEGGRLQFSCNDGFTLEGPDTLHCQSTGTWSANPPRCISVSGRNIMYCEDPEPILNGRVRYFPPAIRPRNQLRVFPRDEMQHPEGTLAEYSCEDGYQLQGSSSMICETSGFWSSDPPNCIIECGRSTMQTSRRIIHGTTTLAGEWPWVVAISVRENNVSRLICGGAVLNSRMIITAAHCLTVADSFNIYFGKLHRRDKDDDMGVMVRRSSRIIIHPDFSNTTYDSDIGLVMFAPRIRYSPRVQPICLPSAATTAKNLMTGKKGYVTGWGLTEKNLQADVLLLANIPFLSNDACMESYRRQNLNLPLTQNMFCAGFEDGQQSACTGDSGSALVFYDRTADRHSLEGLVSFGVQGQCGLPGRYTVFTKVFRFLPWILRSMQ